MPVLYKKTKSPIDHDTLRRELLASAIETGLIGITIRATEEDNAEVWFADTLPAEEETILDGVLASHSGDPSSMYRVWCADCGDYVEEFFVGFPSACPTCSGENIEDVTDKQFAIQGKPVSDDMPSGFHTFRLSDRGGNKWTLHRGYVQFPSKLDKVPGSINITNAIFDGTASLTIESISRHGFKFVVGAVGKAGNWGFTSVEFDWEAVE